MDGADPLRVGAGAVDVAAAVRAAQAVRPLDTPIDAAEAEAMNPIPNG
jgi:hypothetical protein